MEIAKDCNKCEIFKNLDFLLNFPEYKYCKCVGGLVSGKLKVNCIKYIPLR